MKKKSSHLNKIPSPWIVALKVLAEGRFGQAGREAVRVEHVGARAPRPLQRGVPVRRLDPRIVLSWKLSR